MNVLPMERRVAVIHALMEGTSVSAASRLTGVSRPTILALILLVAEGCRRLHDRLVRDLTISLIQGDEMHGFVHTREKNKRATDPKEWGDAWLFIAFGAVSKLIVSWRLGKRDQATTDAVITDLRARLLVIPQFSTDGFGCYPSAVGAAFGDSGVDYGMVVKRKNDLRSKKPRPSDVPFITRTPVLGAPDPKLLSTSLMERVNGSVRLSLRRFTRRSNGFSRTREALDAMIAIWITYYNFARPHETIRCSPAMEAGLTGSLWSIEDLIRAALAEPKGEAPSPQPLRPREGTVGAARQTATGSWLRVVPGAGKVFTKPGIVSVPGAPKLRRAPSVKEAPVEPEQLDFWETLGLEKPPTKSGEKDPANA